MHRLEAGPTAAALILLCTYALILLRTCPRIVAARFVLFTNELYIYELCVSITLVITSADGRYFAYSSVLSRPAGRIFNF